MKTPLHFLLAVLAVNAAWAAPSVPSTPGDAPHAASDTPAASAPAGIIILHAVAGYPAAGAYFTSIQWTDTNGGYAVDTTGAKIPFLNGAIGRILYFDQGFYDEVEHNQYWIDWRAGLQSREVVIAPIEKIHLVATDAGRLQSEQALLEDIVERYPPGQPVVQPMIDALKDQGSKLASGLMLMNGKWVTAAAAQNSETAPTATVGEGNRTLTFTTKKGKKFVDARVMVTDTSVSVITANGGGAVAFEDMPDDLAGFPASAQKQIEAAREKAKAAKAKAKAEQAAAALAAAPEATPATASAKAPDPVAATTPAASAKVPAALPASAGIWETIEYYVSMAWEKVKSVFSSSSSSTASTSTPSSATAATPSAAVPASAVATTPAAPAPATAPAAPVAPATPAQLSANAVVIIKGDRAEGSGFFAMTAQGPVVFTNIHVLAGNPNPHILTSSGQEVQVRDLMGASDRDIAMFSIVDNHYTYLDLASNVEQNTNVGDPTITPGNSEGGEVTLKTDGKVVGIGPQQVEFDNPIYHGNSGGPVFDVRTGKVIAVVTRAMHMDPKNDIDKSSFANANSAIKGPMRYFGFRIDTVPAWESYSVSRLVFEADLLKNFHEVSRALDSFLNGAGYGNASTTEEGPPDAKYYLTNDRVRKAAEEYERTLQSRDRESAVQEIVWSLGTLVDENLAAISATDSFYAYNRERAKYEVMYRQALKDEIGRIQTKVHDATTDTHFKL